MFERRRVMLEFFLNYGGSIIVGLIVLAIAALIIVKSVKDKRAGRFSCGGNCECCGACKSCSSNEQPSSAGSEAQPDHITSGQ